MPPDESGLFQCATEGLRILDGLDDARKLAGLAENIHGTPLSEVEREAQALLERGLLFEEDGRYISLVVESGREEGSL